MSSALNTPVKEKVEKAPNAPVTPQVKKTPLAIERSSYINSGAGRGVRVLAEFEEFPHRIKNAGHRGTFLFFGSARSVSQEDFNASQASLQQQIADPLKSEEDKQSAEVRLIRLRSLSWMCPWWQATHDLSQMLTQWSLGEEGKKVGRSLYTHFPHGKAEQPLVVCTGGGPGFMEAANKGAHSVEGGTSMGVAVNLPFEAGLNPYVGEGLDFQFEYFFSRKFCEVYCAKAMICAPGGMGTCDEMFEVLTLMQVKHMRKVPVVLMGKKFWNDVINFKALAEYAVISQTEVDSICFADTAEEAFDFIKAALVAEAAELKAGGIALPAGAGTPRR